MNGETMFIPEKHSKSWTTGRSISQIIRDFHSSFELNKHWCSMFSMNEYESWAHNYMDSSGITRLFR